MSSSVRIFRKIKYLYVLLTTLALLYHGPPSTLSTIEMFAFVAYTRLTVSYPFLDKPVWLTAKHFFQPIAVRASRLYYRR